MIILTYTKQACYLFNVTENNTYDKLCVGRKVKANRDKDNTNRATLWDNPSSNVSRHSLKDDHNADKDNPMA